MWYLHRHYRQQAIAHFKQKQEEAKREEAIFNKMHIPDSTSINYEKFNMCK